MLNFVKYSCLITIFIFAFIPQSSLAQLDEFKDNFEDGSLDTTWNETTHNLWYSNSEEIYTLTEQNGVLQIDYERTTQSGSTFTLDLPEPVDVSDNPRIKISIKSDIPFTLSLFTFFQLNPPLTKSVVQEISGGGEWHTYIFILDEESSENQTLKRVNFYFDHTYDGNKSGTVLFDNLSISGTIIEAINIQASTIDGNTIQLDWNSSEPDATSIYKIYRSTEKGFNPGTETFITNTGLNSFQNTGLQNYTIYYYRILPVDTLGIEQILSEEIRQETYTIGLLPSVEVEDISSNEYRKYEKTELMVSLDDVVYDNPYNPEDIDLRANFISPSDDTTSIFGFYDNYLNRDQWKVRFAPTETGTWSYEVYVIDTPGISEAASGTFEAIESEHPGYVQISDENPNYLQYSEGDFLYPMAVYYPWNVTEIGLNRLQNYGVDFFGYWNGTYDNAGNGGGNRLIESMDSGLGRYDQNKSARIDQLIEWAEARDMKMMLAIWAHPFVRDGAPGWDPIHWSPYNPYQEIITASEFYTDSLAWTYQKKNFRYVVSRWGYSRALGIWEIMNEMHGTTGYVENPQGGRDWADKAHDYLKELDPYDRPTTASFGGTDAWNNYNVKADMPNRHYYEGQGYPRPFNDNVWDGLYNVVEVYKSLKKTENRPAFLGEAGYTTMFSEAGSDDYLMEFHNALWAGLTNGIASTPFWWDFTTNSIFTNSVMEQYGILKKFTDPLNLSHIQAEQSTLIVSGSEAYAMSTDTMAFGWFWSYEYEDISKLDVRLKGLPTHSYTISWYNTWTGDTIAEEQVVSIEEMLTTNSPEVDLNRQDITFHIQQSENGMDAHSLKFMFYEMIAPITGEPQVVYYFAVYVTDENGRLVDLSGQDIDLIVDGEGTLDQTSVTTDGGYAMFSYAPEGGTSEPFTITASSEGLASAVINESIVTSNEQDEEIEIPGRFDLQQNYPNPFNPSTVISYQLSMNSDVTLEVFDVAGRKVATLVNQKKAAGSYETIFNASGLSSGVYFYKLKSGNFEQIKKMVLVK